MQVHPQFIDVMEKIVQARANEVVEADPSPDDLVNVVIQGKALDVVNLAKFLARDEFLDRDQIAIHVEEGEI